MNTNKTKRFEVMKLQNQHKTCSVDGCDRKRVSGSTSKYCPKHRAAFRIYRTPKGQKVDYSVATESAKSLRQLHQSSDLVIWGIQEIKRYLKGDLSRFRSHAKDHLLLDELQYSKEYDEALAIWDRVVGMGMTLLDNPEHPSYPWNSPEGITPWLVYAFFDSKAKPQNRVSTPARVALIDKFKQQSLLAYLSNMKQFIRQIRIADRTYFPTMKVQDRPPKLQTRIHLPSPVHYNNQARI